MEPASGGEMAVAEEHLVPTIYPVLREFEDASEIASSAARLLAVPRLSDTVTSDVDGVISTFCSELESRFTFLRKKASQICWSRYAHVHTKARCPLPEFRCSWGFESHTYCYVIGYVRGQSKSKTVGRT